MGNEPNSTPGSASSSMRLLAAIVDEFHDRLRVQTIGAIILGLIIGWVLPQVGVGFIGASIILYINRIWGDANCPYGEQAKKDQLFDAQYDHESR